MQSLGGLLDFENEIYVVSYWGRAQLLLYLAVSVHTGTNTCSLAQDPSISCVIPVFILVYLPPMDHLHLNKGPSGGHGWETWMQS